ncbi:MAG: hypothetical protein CSA38_04845 [Flavobacteriales bacterium]|nr:MAG: hypothetical protein CSA38_04845 [Flavobacteriales bacterium]
MKLNQPQRQSKWGILILSLMNTWKFLKSTWVIFIPFFTKFNKETILLYVLPILLVIALVASIYTYFSYLKFTFYIDENNEEFVIRSGVFNRKELRIHRDNIQDININQPFIHRLIGIYELDIDSPGTNKSEVNVKAINFDIAQEIQTYLLDKSSVVKEADAIDHETKNEKQLLKLSLLSLFKYGLTANYLRSFALLFSFVFYIVDKIREFFKSDEIENYITSKIDYQILENSIVLTVVLSFILIFLLIIFVNIIYHVLIYFNLKVERKDEKLNLSYGLLETKNAIISSNKIQFLVETQNFIQRKIGMSGLTFHQIGQSTKKNKNHYLIPACNEEEKAILQDFIWAEKPVYEQELRHNIRWFFVRIMLMIILPITIFYLIFSNEIMDYFPYLMAYSVLMLLILFFGYRHGEIKFGEQYVQVQSGIWDIDKKTIPVEKIQKVKLSQYFWQKKTNLGQIKINTAGGNTIFGTANFAVLKSIAKKYNQIICKKYKNWI